MPPVLGLALLLSCVGAEPGCTNPVDGDCQESANGGAPHAMGLDAPTSLLQVHQTLAVDRGFGGLADGLSESATSETRVATTKGLPKTGANGNFAKMSKVKLNGAGDQAAFFGAMKFDAMLLFLWIAVFTVLHRWYPKTYAYRATHLWTEEETPKADDEAAHTAKTPEEQAMLHDKYEGPYHWTDAAMRKLKEIEDFDSNDFFPAPRQYCRWDPTKPSFFHWIKASLYTRNEYIEETCGLDAAMLLRFAEMAMKMMLIMSIPLGFGFIPIYECAGGDAAGKDYLSYQGIGNVVYNTTIESGQPMKPKYAEMLPKVQWIYWLNAFAVWFIVIYVQWELFTQMRQFMVRRKRWLLAMPKPRATTLLVEGLPDGPDGCCTDKALKERFEALFGQGTIESAFVVKKVRSLEAMIEEWRSFNAEKKQAKAALDKATEATKEEEKQGLQKKIDECTEKMTEKAAEIATYQSDTLYPLMDKPPAEQVYASGSKPWDPQILYATNGFVTFKERKGAELALQQRISGDDEEFVMSYAPDPTDVIYHDLDVNETRAVVNFWIGVGLVVGLFFAFMPIVIAIGKAASIHNIDQIHFLKVIIDATGMQATLAGVLSSLGLTVMMSFLPTFLSMIFTNFFTLRANRWSQLWLQSLYFWFLVVFVLLVTAVGANLEKTIETLAKRPFSVFTLLANKMPLTTHFYMNYVMMQPGTYALEMTRYMAMIKFQIFKRRDHDEEEAVRMAEPEDQDFYGIGGRSARSTLMLLIGLVFGTICPVMNFLVLVNFFTVRLCYGYLLPCAERRKSDLGGVPFCLQLKHISVAMLLYIIMMVGILAHRAESGIPSVIAGFGFFFWAVSFYKFNHHFHWESLAFEDVVSVTYVKMQEPTAKEYCQYAVRWKPEDEDKAKK